jgi:hypothetical protein
MPPPDPLVPVERVIQRGLSRLPLWLSRWLGFRGKPLSPSPTWVVCLWGFIGAFGGLSVILAIFGHTEYFTVRLVPPIVASFVSIQIVDAGS